MTRFIDETGNRYRRLVVIERAENRKDGAIAWLCRCDCGRTCVQRAQVLRSGHAQSCGCYRRERTSETMRLPPGVGARNQVLRGMKANAQSRGLCWRLDDSRVFEWMWQPCGYCGCGPSNERVRHDCETGSFVYNGLDRVDNARGYESDNVVPCCCDCNHAKGTMSADEYRALCARVYRHTNGHKRKPQGYGVSIDPQLPLFNAEPVFEVQCTRTWTLDEFKAEFRRAAK